MNKILNINLGGFALTIDDDAYEYLSAYLDSIRRRFSESEGRDEILNDIEMRLGELITQDMGGRTIVMLPDVEAAIQIMGKPEDFGGEPIDNRRSMGSSRPAPIRTGRRLFRDEDDAVAGGVCSGLSAYFGIADPVWMRLIFVIMTFITSGVWIMAYILMWILVPQARTAAERLAMRGEKINVDNIAREIEEGFDRFGNRVSTMGAQAKKKSGEGGRSFAQFLGGVLGVIGRIFGLTVRFIAKFAVFFAIIIGIGLLLVLIGSWIGGIWALVMASPYIAYFSPFSQGTTYLGLTNAFFLLIIPVIGLCLFFARILFKRRTPWWVTTSLAIFWTVNLISAIGLVGVAAKDFRQRSSITKTIDLSAMPNDTLHIEWAKPTTEGEDERWWGHNEGVRLSDDHLELQGNVDIRVRRSESDRFEGSQTITARGSSQSEAVSNANLIDFSTRQEGNRLLIPLHYSIPEGSKWRNQEIKLTIAIPVGKYVVFGREINYHIYDAPYADPEGDYHISSSPDRLFRMTPEGLVCADCPRFGDKEYRSERYFENFILEGDFTTEIRHADDFSLQIEGPADARNQIETIRVGQKLTLTTNGKTVGSGTRVIIKTPVFTDLYADNSGEITIRGFEEGRSQITARGSTRIKAYLDSNHLGLSLSGPCQLELTGSGNHLEARLTDGAVLEALKWQAQTADISASDKARARLFIEGSADIRSDASSEVKVEGNGNIIRQEN